MSRAGLQSSLETGHPAWAPLPRRSEAEPHWEKMKSDRFIQPPTGSGQARKNTAGVLVTSEKIQLLPTEGDAADDAPNTEYWSIACRGHLGLVNPLAAIIGGSKAGNAPEIPGIRRAIVKVGRPPGGY